ncbi:MAG TPA: sigma-54 dependent transcriptional regulator [Planctomycetota bacterium]|nr:sigma-54 dependent transcriptional regulator [Planctomycetota bacterium]
MARTALVADDDALSREFLAEAVGAAGFDVRTASDGVEALALLERDEPDVVVTDLRMPGKDGLEVLKAAKARRPDRPVIVLTAYGAVDVAVRAMREGAADFLQKPVSPDALDVVLRRVQETERLRRENRALKEDRAADVRAVGVVLGRNAAFREAVAMAERVAPRPSTVLIRGESGTGKELIAALVHENSARRKGPFIRVNCAALTDSLLTSELFGHERGAFTGAVKAKEGRFELAQGGTLFLDEIGEMSPETQAKLLRVLECGEFERVGGVRTLKADVRVIAATNRDLEKAMEDGRFRADLFHRLDVFTVHLPPLRERPEDLADLAQHFLERYRRDLGSEAKKFSRAAVEAMAAYDWPGNVRELGNVVQRALLRAPGAIVEAEHLGLAAKPAASREPTVPVGLSVDETERHLILRTLDLVGWNRTEASRILGVTTRTLSNKLRIYRARGFVAPAEGR